jgi:PAS domain S-box-containing protein
MEDANILIVEDDAIVAKHLESCLKEMGYGLTDTISSGEKALLSIEGNRPDLVLMDIVLKGELDGVETAERVRGRWDIPVVYLTAFSDSTVLQRAKISEPYGYILKPFEERSLHATLQMALHKHRLERQLSASEKRYRQIVETSQEGIWTVDIAGFTTYVNQRMAEMLGETVNDLEGQPITEYFIYNQFEETPEAFRQRFSGDRESLEGWLRRKDGKRIWVLASISPIVDEYGKMTGVLGMFTDITQRKQAEEILQHQFSRLASLRTIDTAITTSQNLRLILNTLLKQLVSQLRVDASDVLLYDLQGSRLEFHTSIGFLSGNTEIPPVNLDSGVAGQVALNLHTTFIPNLSAAENFIRAERFRDEGFIAYYGVPLIAQGKIKGVLEVFHRAPLNPNQEWLDFLETVSGQAAIAIDRAQLFEGLQRSNIELTRAYDDNIEGWSRALDLRNRETGDHTKRVTELTVELARVMGVNSEDLVHIRRGALLHDIGKMGIPDHILLKPGPLDPEEWQIMRMHPVYAYDLLSPITFLRLALDIPYCHHEKWDGSGYPRGLKGEVIPLSARIFAIIDVWEALSNDRVYRKKWPEDKVLAHIGEQSGKHFDPKVVQAFLNIINSGLK